MMQIMPFWCVDFFFNIGRSSFPTFFREFPFDILTEFIKARAFRRNLRITMSSFVRVVLFLVFLNILQASNNTNSDNEEKAYLHNTTQGVEATKNEKRKIIQEFETQLERRNKLDRKSFR